MEDTELLELTERVDHLHEQSAFFVKIQFTHPEMLEVGEYRLAERAEECPESL